MTTDDAAQRNPYDDITIAVTPVITREYAMVVAESDGTVIDRQHFATQGEAEQAAAILREWFALERAREEAVK